MAESYEYFWRFASHPRFPYWAFNMKQRHGLLTQSRVYIKQHPCDTKLTVLNEKDQQLLFGQRVLHMTIAQNYFS